MGDSLRPAERRVIERLRAVIAHGYGEILIVVSGDNLEIQRGLHERMKIGVDKNRPSV